ncbi:putative serine protease PepD [Sanguibacter gelidistatuariae]|uniref:Putative serine protease PepD n=1 Tax=Sanguibacter gelidistatuariae TaxID=1814289 RepID=A0A1G6MGH3_9MICO|nr:trypsin-like peptidase domain-containing protein [Sanguibacter gelidistatuariae]SDC54623.1 putative serine protease PepD [Sanguibacter gelidistatuariae]
MTEQNPAEPQPAQPELAQPQQPAQLPPVPLPPGHGAPSFAAPSNSASPYVPQPEHSRYAPAGAVGEQPEPGVDPANQSVGQPDPAAEQWTGVQAWFEQSGETGEPATPKTSRRKAVGAGTVGALLVGALVMGAVGGIAGQRAWDHFDTNPGQPLPTISANPDITRPDGSIADIAATVAPSVVSIHVAGADGQGTGSGFIIREDGYILTNNHVIAGAVPTGTIRVTFVDGSEEEATLIGRTSDYDLAVIRVDRDGLTPLVLGDSDSVVVGDPVIAIGAPLGLDGTVTSGIISALNRPVTAGDSADTAFINALQTDAAINPGNSGGPLVNGSGEVIGINSAIAQPPGTFAAGNIGLGFAIGSNQARRTADEIIATGSATYPIIGVLLDSAYDGEGVQVVTSAQNGQPAVTPGGPAETAGIKAGDVILAVDGRPVTQSDQLIVAIRAKAPGDTVVLRVRTGDDERDVSIVLDTATSKED